MAEKGGFGAALREKAALTGRRRKLLIGVGLTLVILLIAGVNVYHNRQDTQIPVRAEPVQVLQLENTVFATGTVHPVEQQEIVTVAERDVLAVPYEAVVERDEGTWVFVVEGNRVRRQEVEVRRGNELYEEVVSGLQEREMVVIGPPDNLQGGDRVRVPRGGGSGAAR